MIRELIPNPTVGMKHLDLGVGDGLRMRMLKPEGEIVGVDVDKEMLVHTRDRRVEPWRTSAERLPFRDESFELVTAIEMLEHVEHPVLVLSEVYRVLKPTGLFVCVIPNETLLFHIIWKFWTSFGMGKFWRGKHLYVYRLWRHTRTGMGLIDLLRDLRLQPEKVASANLGMIIGVRCVKV